MSDTKSTQAFDPAPSIARESGLPLRGVVAVIALLDAGNTVPFIARYRKEQTGDLDEVQIRMIEERRGYLRELEERRAQILESIAGQGHLTPELKARIEAATTKATLEDLYLPYRPKRRTRAMIARERGLEALAERIRGQDRRGTPRVEAGAFVSAEAGVGDVDAALQGARDIVAEQVSETPEVRSLVRAAYERHGILVSEVNASQVTGPTRFEQYYEFREAVSRIPSHRFLAIRRGEKEEVLRVRIEVEEAPLLAEVERVAGLNPDSPWAGELRLAVEDAFHRLISPGVETDLRVELKLRSDREAVEVFARNLADVLLQSPLGQRVVVGVDPGLRTGCKCAVVDATGRFGEYVTVFPHTGEAQAARAERDFVELVRRVRPFAVAVGNGTGGRETEAFVRRVLKRAELNEVHVIPVSEAGASVYSASDVAREEFPELDLTIRGAISIARRLQDPLAELVKIDPKSIGVGQYQHDVHQPLLQRKLDEVVESCVNRVGVELNSASASLLAYVAGIGPSVAKKIVVHRDANGPFRSRRELLGVSGVGPRTFEQAAGFLRIREGAHPLDGSAVHPERYGLVEQMARDLGVSLEELVGNAELARRIEVRRYVGGDVGEPTLRDIVDELSRPGRDPRESFEAPRFLDDVHAIEDLRPGMEIEGVVTNVTAFGAFVDIGVHQDGLVHISQLSDRYVRDPSEVVRAGQRLLVRVLDVDAARKRIALSARKEGAGETADRAGAGPSFPADASPASRDGRGAGRAEGGDRRPGGNDRRPGDGGGRPGGGDGRSGGGGGAGRPSKGRDKPTNDDGALRHNPFAALVRKG